MIIGLQVFVGNHACCKLNGEFLHFMMVQIYSLPKPCSCIAVYNFKNKPSVCAGSKKFVVSHVILCGRKKVPLPDL